MHWDGDRFFASIEQAADRRLRNRPVVVGAAQRGIVLSASAEARRYGIRPGMPTRRAVRACPPLVVIPGHFDLYEQFFQQIVGLCEQTTPLVEPVSVGAAYLDLTGTAALHGKGAESVVDGIQTTVQRWLHVSFSSGIAANKTVARIASRLRKPAGRLVVAPGTEAAFLAPLTVRWLEGVGPEIRETLELAGVRTLGALARAPLDALQLALGRQALRWQRRAQGVDEDPVRARQLQTPQWREQMDFPEEEWEEPKLLRLLRPMLERLLARLRAARMEARQLSLWLRYTDRDESYSSTRLPSPSDLECDFEGHLPGLLRATWKRRVRIRSMALSLAKLYQPSPQLSLFPEPKRENGSLRKLATAIDLLRSRYGEAVIVRGAPETRA